jgi:pimeloyl-ACP methyl ester carboxylesterase
LEALDHDGRRLGAHARLVSRALTDAVEAAAPARAPVRSGLPAARPSHEDPAVDRRSFVVAGGVRLVADVVGPPDGPRVVLLHGGGQTRFAWGTTLQTLAADGWRAYTVDLRGHGESDWAPDGDYSLDAFASDVRAVARAVQEPGQPPPALVGASLGGIASLVAIAESDRPPLASALVLVDVAPRVEPAGAVRIGDFMRRNLEDGFGSLEEVADAIAEYNPHRRRPDDLSGLRKNLRQRPDGRWTWHWDPEFITGRRGSPDETRSTTLMNEARLQSAARSLTIPTLLVRGRMSDIVSDEGARELQGLVAHAHVVDVADAGHMVAGDKNDLFNDAVVRFLDAQRSDDDEDAGRGASRSRSSADGA